MKEIYATTRVSRRNRALAKDGGANFRVEVMRDLARALAEQLLSNQVMEIREDTDPETGDLIVRAGVYAAEPGERVLGFYGKSPARVFDVPRFETSFMAYDRMTAEEMERAIAPPKVRPGSEFVADAQVYFGFDNVESKKIGAPAPTTLTQEKLAEAIAQLKGQVFPKDNDLYMSMINPLTYLEDRMTRKRAAADGEASAVAKVRGEKEVRENTKKRGVSLTIEVGVRKITMPEPEKETG